MKINLQAVDIWSMGVTLYTFVTGNVPWIAEGTPALHAMIKQQPVVFPEDLVVSDSLKRLLLRMLDKDHTSRITLPEIKVRMYLLIGFFGWFTSLVPLGKTDN